jgi:hypothetical protein
LGQGAGVCVLEVEPLQHELVPWGSCQIAIVSDLVTFWRVLLEVGLIPVTGVMLRLDAVCVRCRWTSMTTCLLGT